MLRPVSIRTAGVMACAAAILAVVSGALAPQAARSAEPTPTPTPAPATAPPASGKLAGPTVALVPHADGVLVVGHQDLTSDALTATAVDAAGGRSEPATLQHTDIIDVVTATGGTRFGALWVDSGKRVTRLRFAEWRGTQLVAATTLARTTADEFEGLSLAIAPDGGVVAGWTTATGRRSPYRYQPWVAIRPANAPAFGAPVAVDRASPRYDAAGVAVDLTVGGVGVVRVASMIAYGSTSPKVSIVRRISPGGRLSSPIRGLRPASTRGSATMRLAISPRGEIVAVDETVRGGRYRVRATRVRAGALKASAWTSLVNRRVRGPETPQVVAMATPEVAVDADGRAVAAVPLVPAGLMVIEAAPGDPFHIAAHFPGVQAFDPLLLARADGWPTLIASRAPSDSDAPPGLVGYERAPDGAWVESGSVPIDTDGHAAGIADAVRLPDGRVAVAVNAEAEDEVTSDGYLVFGSLATLAGPP